MPFITKPVLVSLLALIVSAPHLGAQLPAPATKAPAPAGAAATDKLGRENPRSSVTNFLQTCRRQDYNAAAQYLDLRYLSQKNRDERGPEVAKRLAAILNSAPHFSLFRLSANPAGEPDTDSSVVPVTTLSQGGETYTLELERVTPQPNGPAVWIFSPDTVQAAFYLNPLTTEPWFVHYLPPFLVSVEFLETPLWKWLALILAAIVLISLSRHLDRVLRPVLGTASKRLAKTQSPWAWTQALLGPLRLFLSLVVYRIAVEAIGPSPLARVYIGRTLEILVVWSVAWCLLRIVDLFLTRVETSLASSHEFSGRSILRLGRRTASVTIIILAILLVLSSWGYNTATLVAGLGVGGIAIALAAQQTIANVFGGVSVIGDHPVSIGDFGKFGDLVGTVEDIGMRSTQVRTLGRTVVSIPNSTFAGANLENYSVRDKILFNPTFPIKRTTPDEEVWHLLDAIKDVLQKHQSIELVPTPVRVTGLTAAAFNVEVFCYVLTADIDEFYKVQSELFVAINDAFQAAHLELV